MIAQLFDLFFALENHLEKLESLFAYTQTDPNIQDKYGSTALFYACEYGHAKIVEKLLKNGANPNIQNKYGSTPLILASRWGKEEVVNVLLQQKTEDILKELYPEIHQDLSIQVNENQALPALPMVAQKSLTDFSDTETNTSNALY